jgi:hypothetical protein
MSDDLAWSGQVARDLLADSLPRRWAHTQGVAARARSLAAITGADVGLITAAAWLHDIGYAPAAAVTGFHPLDGARYLRDVRQADPRLCRLVAHHTYAVMEARERGLADTLLAEFEPERPDLTDILTYCDMTTSPADLPVTVEKRLAEISTRYGRGHVVDWSISRAAPRIRSSACAVTAQILAHTAAMQHGRHWGVAP